MLTFPIFHNELLAKLCQVPSDFTHDNNFDDWMFVAMEMIMCRWFDFEHVQYMMRDTVGMLVSVVLKLVYLHANHPG